MPVDVPKEPKRYTTIYENFKGVDFTNDPSNVYRRRSPGGKNMIPDLDGKPYKRTGWTVEYSAEDFITASGSQATTVTPRRMHHFSLGGQDYLMIFNSLGVFYTNESLNTVVKCQLASYDGNNNIVTSAFPPAIDGVSLEADSGRTFFFEANGVAGLYTFVGTKLFRFDGQYYWEEEPYVPIVLATCDANGTGSLLDRVNLLTTERTVQYQCNGENTSFIVPSGIDVAKGYKIEMFTIAGQWEEQVNGDTYTWSYDNGVITFSPAPPVGLNGEDGMRITYHPSNVYASTQAKTLISNAYRYDEWVTYDRRHYTTVHYAGAAATSYNSSGTNTNPVYSYEDAVFQLENPVSIDDAIMSPDDGTKTVNAYNSSVTYRATNEDYDANEPGYWSVYGYARSTVRLYCSTVSSDLWNAISTQDYDSYPSVEYLGEFCGTVENGTSSEVNACHTQIKSIENAHQARYGGITYHYAYEYTFSQTNRKTRTVACTLVYDAYVYATTDGEDSIGSDKSAFMTCQRATVYGSGLANQVFMGASRSNGYRSRVWYSAVARPNYFPDLNYVEVGSNDTSVMGMLKCDEYLGVIKAGNALDSSIYLAYPTSFGDDVTYAVKQSIAGVGALSMGAFNILSEEPVFLSEQGVMGIEFSTDNNRLRNRSYFIDKKLKAEPGLANAISYVFNNMYYLSVNNHCYVLDGTQKSSWVNEKTNLQYECYYLDNVPAQCFADMGGSLYFTDYNGNLCRFKSASDVNPYRDDYMVGHATIEADDVTGSDEDGTIEMPISDLEHGGTPYTADDLSVGMMVHFTTADSDFSITELTDTTVTLNKGMPITARWDTIADDDGMVHFFKNLNKKGFVVSLLPGSTSGVEVSFKPDEKAVIPYGTVDSSGNVLPYDYFVRKKIKKYKRLQIICENDGIDQSFGLDQIIKTYTVGNYSKNRR